MNEKKGADSGGATWYSRPGFHAVLIFIAAFFYFGGTKNNGIALDDIMVLSENTFVQRGTSGIPDIFTHDSFYGATHRPATQLGWRYRPLSVAVFAIAYRFFGRDWSLYHLLNVFFYALACLVAYGFMRKWVFNGGALAMVTTLLYLIHPVHCEVVANIKSLDEILSFLFSVLCLDYFLRQASGHKNRNRLVSGFFFLLALFSKESSVLIAALAPLLLYVKTEKPFLKCLAEATPFALLTVVFVLVRLGVSAVPESNPGLTTDPYFLATSSEKLATVALVLGKYLLLLFYPNTLIFDYGYRHIPYVTFSDSAALASLLFHFCLVGFAMWSVRKRQWTGFLLLAYVSGVVLLSNLLLNVGPIMAERFVFTPGFFLLVAVVEGGTRLLGKHSKLNPVHVFAGLLAICMPFAYAKVTARNAEWKNNSTLYKADLTKAPDSFRVLAFNGIQTVSDVSGENDTAITHPAFRTAIGFFEKAYAIYPDYKNMYKEWGYAYLMLDKLDSAEWAWNRFKLLSPDSRYHAANDRLLRDARFAQCMKSYNDHYKENDYPFLIRILNKAVEYKPEDAPTWINLGKVYYLDQKRDSASYSWKQALKADTANREAAELLRLF